MPRGEIGQFPICLPEPIQQGRQGNMRLRDGERVNAVLFASGKGTRRKIHDHEFLDSFRLDPTRQLIGSQCSGALILARLGLLQGIPATTHRAVQQELRETGVTVVSAPFVAVGNVATAGGCLSSQYLVGWVLERALGTQVRKTVLASLAPVGQEAEYEERVTAALCQEPIDGFIEHLPRHRV